MRPRRSTRRVGAALAALGVVAAAGVGVAGPVAARSAAKPKALVGVFRIDAGADAGSGVTGSSFRMVQPGGTVAAGPFVPNADSAASDKTYTLLAPGTSGGLVTGRYQPQPDPPFDAAGNGTAGAIVTPTTFFGVQFAVSTNKTDPQTGDATKRPTVTVKGRKLGGTLGAVGVAYGKQHFNQGAPKPDGSRPAGTTGPKGTFDPQTGAFTLEWSSAIVGGPFDGFTGIWHLEGTFEKAAR